MNRRGFLRSLLGLAAAPITSALPALPVAEVSGMSLMNRYFGDVYREESSLFRGELGRWEGVRMITPATPEDHRALLEHGWRPVWWG